MANGGSGQTAAGNLRHARLSNACNLVKRAWESISPEVIIQSFKTCNITGCLTLNEDTNKECEEFEIIDDSDGEESMDMIIPCASHEAITILFLELS
ncbi:hypothetical protein RclHR1_00740016 [Rhizophagus clarus]|nr:hypothetical protein RclHR1_00740016 [Rhizophagus clarus]